MSNPEIPEIKTHYPYVTRSVVRLFGMRALTNVESVDVEPKYGYVTRLNYTNGDHRVTYGNDLGLNTGSAQDLAKDKGHTKFILRQIGVNCPDGEEFLLPWWADSMRASRAQKDTAILTTDDASSYIADTVGYPVYVKPVSGSKGASIFKVENDQELTQAFAGYEESRVKVAMVEEPILMPDYRVVVLDGELISAYERVPLEVIGDGLRTVDQLIEAKQAEFDAIDRDTNLHKIRGQIETHLAQRSLSMKSVVPAGASQVLVPVSNLSTGGTSVDVGDRLHARWSEMAAMIASNFNLRLVGVDLACDDITSSEANYSVLEINSTPGLDHYAQSGEAQRLKVDELYTKALNAFPSPSA